MLSLSPRQAASDRESAKGVGLFDDEGNFNAAFADRFANAFGLEAVIFEAPNKPSQFTMLEHFGTHVHLCSVEKSYCGQKSIVAGCIQMRLESEICVRLYRRSWAERDLRVS